MTRPTELDVPTLVWHDPSLSPAVSLHRLDLATIDALARGDLAAARVSSGLMLDPHLVADGSRGVWRVRSTQIAEHPAHAPWITRALVLGGDVVGKAGFHGPPEPGTGMVEVGYSVAPERRRQGLGRAALRLMRAVAEHAPDARVLRATVSPGNVASRNLVLSEGLVEVGEQWDDEDGLEIVYEARLG